MSLFINILILILEPDNFYGNSGIYQAYPDFYPNQGPPPNESFMANAGSNGMEMPPIAHQGKQLLQLDI